MAKRVRSDLRGVPQEKLATWQHHLDQLHGVEAEAMQGTSRWRPSDWSKRKDIRTSMDVTFDTVHRALRSSNVSAEQFRDIGGREMARARVRLGLQNTL